MVHHGITMVLFQQGQSVADPEFHNGGQTVEGNGSGEGAVPPPQKKIEFLPENGGFGAFKDYFLRLSKNWSSQWGAAVPPPPLDPPLIAYPVQMHENDNSARPTDL